LNLERLDWVLFVILFVTPLVGGFVFRRYIQGVADYLVAGRSVGRYLGLGSDAMQAMGAVTILAYWQMNYQSGFSGQWWYLLTPAAGILVALTGWGVYRFRESRAMTLGELVGRRYGEKARIFFGAVAFLAGIINMGIFPAVGAGFFIYFCGFPESLSVAGLVLPTALVIMVVFVGAAVALCLWGGQVTVVVTDFFQSLFINAMLVGITVFLFRTFSWEQFRTTYEAAPNGTALLNPFRLEGAGGFDYRFFLIHVYYWMFYSVVSWSPNSMQVSSARDAHEGRMMRVMLHVRYLAMMGLGLFILPLAAYVLMHHPDFTSQSAAVEAALGNIANVQVKSQMIVPAAVGHILPSGILGAFAGVVLFSFITTHDTYLLSWGSLLIQDVVIPLRGHPLPREQHLRWLRVSVVGVAVFIVAFSLLFRQVDNIFMFMDISASIYTGAAGVVLLGGLYWKRGTRTAAWVTMIAGLALSLTGFVYRSIDPDFLDGRIMAFWVSVICILLYVTVSLLGREPEFDLDRLLHRNDGQPHPRWWNMSRGDRILIPVIYSLVGLFLLVHGGVALYHLTHEVPTSRWLAFWPKYLYAMFAFGSVFLVWISIGGFRDLRVLLKKLRAEKLDETDDGFIAD
jgi:SSS family solute:Na+ symporter